MPVETLRALIHYDLRMLSQRAPVLYDGMLICPAVCGLITSACPLLKWFISMCARAYTAPCFHESALGRFDSPWIFPVLVPSTPFAMSVMCRNITFHHHNIIRSSEVCPFLKCYCSRIPPKHPALSIHSKVLRTTLGTICESQKESFRGKNTGICLNLQRLVPNHEDHWTKSIAEASVL